MISFIEYNNISSIGDEVAMSVDDSGIQTYDIAEGKKGVSFQCKEGTGPVGYGGKTTVAPATNRGGLLYGAQALVYKNVKNAFTIGFRCPAGKTATILIVNHD